MCGKGWGGGGRPHCPGGRRDADRPPPPTSAPAAAAPAAAALPPPRGTPAAGAMTRADPLPEAAEVGAAPCIC